MSQKNLSVFFDEMRKMVVISAGVGIGPQVVLTRAEDPISEYQLTKAAVQRAPGYSAPWVLAII